MFLIISKLCIPLVLLRDSRCSSQVFPSKVMLDSTEWECTVTMDKLEELQLQMDSWVLVFKEELHLSRSSRDLDSSRLEVFPSSKVFTALPLLLPRAVIRMPPVMKPMVHLILPLVCPQVCLVCLITTLLSFTVSSHTLLVNLMVSVHMDSVMDSSVVFRLDTATSR